MLTVIYYPLFLCGQQNLLGRIGTIINGDVRRRLVTAQAAFWIVPHHAPGMAVSSLDPHGQQQVLVLDPYTRARKRASYDSKWQRGHYGFLKSGNGVIMIFFKWKQVIMIQSGNWVFMI